MAIDLLTAALASKLSYQNSSSESTSSLPSVTSTDNGDVLGVVSGAWAKSALKTINSQSLLGSGNIDVSGLPSVTGSDNGKALTVVNGTWTASKQDFSVELGMSGNAWIAKQDYNDVTAAIAAGKRVYATVQGNKVTDDSIIGSSNVTLILPLSGEREQAGNNAYIFSAIYRGDQKSIEVTAILPSGLSSPTVTSVTHAVQDPLYVDYTITGLPIDDVYPMYTDTNINTIFGAWMDGRDVIARITQDNSIMYLPIAVVNNNTVAFSTIFNTTNSSETALYQIVHTNNNNVSGYIIPLITDDPIPLVGTEGQVLTVDETGSIYWGDSGVTSFNGQTGDVTFEAVQSVGGVQPDMSGDVDINFITGIYRNEDNELIAQKQDGTADSVALPGVRIMLQLNDQQVETGLAQIKSLAEASPENLIKVKFIHAELCITVIQLVIRALLIDGDMPFIQVAEYLGFVFSGGNQNSTSIEEAGVSFQCIYGSYEWTMSFTLDGVIFITCIYHNNYTLMPVGDEHTVSEVCTEIWQSVQAMSYGTLQANMDSDNEFQVPMYTTGWDSIDGQTEFIMIRKDYNKNIGNIIWAGVTYLVSISWDDVEQTFSVYNVIPQDLS